MNPIGKDYLGDSVYAETDNSGIWLTTENGLPTDPGNRIYLEELVIDALLMYIDRLKQAAR